MGTMGARLSLATPEQGAEGGALVPESHLLGWQQVERGRSSTRRGLPTGPGWRPGETGSEDGALRPGSKRPLLHGPEQSQAEAAGVP